MWFWSVEVMAVTSSAIRDVRSSRSYKALGSTDRFSVLYYIDDGIGIKISSALTYHLHIKFKVLQGITNKIIKR